jgi:phage protein U
MYAQLGSTIFEGLKSFTGVSSVRETNFAELPLIEGKPKLQRIGTKLENISINMLLSIDFCVPQDEIDSLDASREAGEILPLISGNGLYVGNFVIKTIRKNELHTTPEGDIMQVDLQVDLVEHYDADLANSIAVGAINTGFAMAQNDPPLFAPIIIPVTPAGDVGAALAGAYASGNDGATLLEKLNAEIEGFRNQIDTAMQKMYKTGDEIADILQLINADTASELYARTRNLAANCDVMTVLIADVITEGLALIADIDNGNTAEIPGRVSSLIQKGLEVRNRVKLIQTSASNFTAYLATL